MASFDELLMERKSERSFSGQHLAGDEVTELLRVADKIPFAGGIYSFDFHIITDHLDKLSDICAKQNFIKKAGAVIAIAADLSAVKKRYSGRAKRYIFIEAGHSAQNITLKALELGLKSVCVGAFKDKELAKFLGLDDSCIPVYLIVLGK